MYDLIWSICCECIFYNSFRDINDNPIDLEDEDFNIDFNGSVDCDRAKDYLKIENGSIKNCPGYSKNSK